MDKIIEVKISGSYLTRDSQNAGVQGEANAAALRIAFDASWDGLAKTVTWWNARGENEVKRILTVDLLENITESGRVYLAPIPGEALELPGKCRFAVDGYISGRRQRSVYSELVVKPAGGSGASTVEEPTPTQAEQLQIQLDTLLEDLQARAVLAVDSAAEAADSAAEAKSSATAAGDSAAAAAVSAAEAADNAAAAGTSAVGAAASESAARSAADRAQAEAERASVPAVEGVYNVVLADRVTGERYALITEEGGLTLLSVSRAVNAAELTLIDNVSGTAYAVEVENGGLILKEV